MKKIAKLAALLSLSTFVATTAHANAIPSGNMYDKFPVSTKYGKTKYIIINGPDELDYDDCIKLGRLSTFPQYYAGMRDTRKEIVFDLNQSFEYTGIEPYIKDNAMPVVFKRVFMELGKRYEMKCDLYDETKFD